MYRDLHLVQFYETGSHQFHQRKWTGVMSSVLKEAIIYPLEKAILGSVRTGQLMRGVKSSIPGHGDSVGGSVSTPTFPGGDQLSRSLSAWL